MEDEESEETEGLKKVQVSGRTEWSTIPNVTEMLGKIRIRATLDLELRGLSLV